MRLLSYNIHKGIGGRDRRYRLERVLSVIEAENPDIICLQEVDRQCRRSRHDDQPRLVTERFSYPTHVFQMNVQLKQGGYGNFVCARWPLVAKHQISLRLKRRKPRGAQFVVLDTPEGKLHLVHWHLGLAERERHWQVRHMLEHSAFAEHAELPTLVVGDFNDWRNTLGRSALGQCGFEQATAPPSRFRSFPAYLPLGSLDKAYFRGGIGIREARIARSVIARDASDHLPLVVDFHLESG